MRLRQIHWLFLLAVLPALVSLSLFAYLSYQRDSAALGQQTLQMTRALSQLVDRGLIDTMHQAEILGAVSTELDQGDFAAFYRKAKQVMVETGRGEAVALTDSSGQLLVNTYVPYGQPLPKTRNPDRIVQVFATGRPQISNLIEGTVTQQPLITIDVPVMRNGKVAYALDAAIFTERLDRFIRGQGLPAGWGAVIFDRNGVIVARVRNSDQYVGHKLVGPLLAALRRSDEGVIETATLEGIPSTVAFHRSARTGFGVAVGVPEALLNAQLRTAYGYAAIGIAAVTLLTFYLALRFGGVLESRRMADAARIEFESRFRAIFESSENGILIAAVDSRSFVDANPAICAMLGYTREELLSMRVDDVHPPAEVAMAVEGFDRAARGLARQANEQLFMRKDGSVFPADINVSRLEIQGRPCMAGIITDLTERKRMEGELESYSHGLEERIAERTAALQATLEKLEETQFAMDRVGIAIHWVDPETGRFTQTNEYGSSLYGYTTDEMLGLTVPEIDPTFSPEHFAMLIEWVREAGSRRFESLAKTKDGRLIPIELTLYYALGVGGGPDRVIAFITDIRQRKEAEQSLLESEERLRLFIHHAPAALALFDQDMHYLEASERWLSDYGLEGQTILGRSHYDVFPEIDERWREFHRRALQGEILKMDEDRFVRADGQVQWLRWELRPWRRADGSLGGIAIFTEDISARKQADTEIRELRTEMEQLTRLQVARQTVSAIAHELNQPLNAVASYSEAALRLLRGGNRQPEKLLHALEGSVRQAKRAGQVVRELLMFLNQEHFQSEALPLNDLVRGVLERVQVEGGHDFTPELRLDPDLQPVRANRLQIEKVLVNLIENGIEAMHGMPAGASGMTILVRTGSMPGMAQVTVQDKGAGIDPVVLNHVFDAFYTTKPGGLGMGLAISRAIVEAHGGQLWAESLPGAGACFHFTLPLET
jgi:two-component system sensor kinase FixL